MRRARRIQFLVANLSQRKVRRETLGGRKYLVAPLTLIVPGVLNGSKGPLFYPPEEISKSTSAWNNVPIVVYHPKSDKGHVSAKDPEVLDKQGIGMVLKANISGKNGSTGKLRAEGWFDEQRTRKVDPRVYSALMRGKPMEVSTGLYTDNETAENGAEHRGRPYSYVARNYRPDHLAILPDQQGACSVKDGCGMNVNQRSKVKKPISNRRNDMAKRLKAEKRQEIIANLLACNDCGWNKEDQATLEGLPDEKLVDLAKAQDGMKALAKKAKDQEAVTNAALKGFSELYGDEAKGLAINEVPAFIKKKIDYKGAGCAEGDDACMEKNQKGKAVKNEENKAKLTREEVLNALSAEDKEDLAFARREKAKQKDALVSRLTANVEDEAQKAKLAERLKAKDLDELQDLLALAPAKEEKAEARSPNYVGAAGAVTNTLKDEERGEGLGIPVLNFEDSRLKKTA